MALLKILVLILLLSVPVYNELFCQSLPSLEKAKRIVAEHQKELSEIQAFEIYVESKSCPGKGYIVFDEAEPKIVKKAFGKAFFGIPYRVQID